MKARPALLFVVVVIVAALPAVMLAEDGAWKMPNLNPFSQKGKPPTSARAASTSNSGWHWPSLWSSSSTKKAKTNSKQPTALQNVTKGTKQLFSKTADALNPWDDAQAKQAQPPKVTGSNTVFSQASNSKAKAKDSNNTSLIPSWPWGANADANAKEQKPKTVTDFLSQPRPQP